MKTISSRHRSVAATWATLLVLGALATVSSRAHAQGSATGDPEVLIQQGLELREKGDDGAALVQFRRAYDLVKSGRALAQVALAEQALGRWVDAEAHLTEAIGRADDAWIARQKTLLEQALGEIQNHLGSLEITGGRPGAEVLVNGQTAGRMPLAKPLRVPAGSVALELRATGYLPVQRTVIVAARTLAREPVILVPVAGSLSEPPPQQGARPLTGIPAIGSPEEPVRAGSGSAWGWRRTTGWVLIAAGAAGIGTGVGFHIARESRAKAFNRDGCANPNGTVIGPAGCQATYDGIQSAGGIALAGYIGGAVLAGAGIVLLYTHRGGTDDAPAARPSEALLVCGPGAGLGISCGARF